MPTVCLYAHHDVQPEVIRLVGLRTFNATEANGRLFGRGSSDDRVGSLFISLRCGPSEGHQSA